MQKKYLHLKKDKQNMRGSEIQIMNLHMSQFKK